MTHGSSITSVVDEAISVRSALVGDAEALTQLVFRAKAFWGYPQEWMEAWRNELTVTRQYVAAHRLMLAEIEQRPVAFYGLEFRVNMAHLEHLWVVPEHIGSGLGRKLLALACEDAKSAGYEAIQLIADPHAEGFYLRHGALRIGDVHGTVLGTPRVLPKMRLQV
jgi:predicted N-acetyltransferase YhbS